MNSLAQTVPAPDRSQQARLAKRREMIQAASDTFTALGYELSSMALIAEAAGVTKGTLYVCFGSKAELFRTVVHDGLNELPDAVSVNAPDGQLRMQLNAIAQALVRHATHPASLTVARILSQSGCIPPKQWRRRHRPYRLQLEKVLSRCTGCSDPAQAASQFLLLAVGSLDSNTVMPTSESRVAAAVDLFVRTYGDLDLRSC